MNLKIQIFVSFFLLLFFFSAPLHADRSSFSIQAFVIDKSTGDPLEGFHTLDFNIYNNEEEDSLFNDSQTVEFVEGVFYTTIEVPLDVIMNNESLFLGIAIEDDSELEPPLEYFTTPYSILADHSDTSALADVATTALNLASDNLSTIVGPGLTVSGGNIRLDTGTAQTYTGSQTYNAQTIFALDPSDTTSASAVVRINPTSLNTDEKLIAIQSSGSDRFTVDKEGDTTIVGTLSVTGAITLSGLANCDTIDTNSSGLLSCGTDTAGNIDADSLNFTHLSDTLALDASTSIAFDAAEQLTFDASTADTTTTSGVLDINVDSQTSGAQGVNLTLTAVDDDAADTLYGFRTDVTIQDDTTATDTAYGNYIGFTQNDTSGAGVGIAIVAEDAGSSVVSTGLLIENLQATDIDITDAIKIQAATDGSIATALNVSDNEITTAIAIGSNDVTVGGVTIGSAEFAYLDTVSSNLQTQLDAKSTSTLADGRIFVGSAGNVATAVAMSGDATIANSGALTIAASAVGSSEITDGTVATGDIATDTILAGNIAAGAVGTSEIADGVVTTDDIATDTIAAADIAAAAVGTSEIADGTVATGDIATDTILAGNIAAGAVGTSEIADGTVSTDDIATDTIAAADIAAGAIGTSELADGVIAAADLDLSMTPTWTGNHTFKKADPSLILDVTTDTDTDFWIGVQDDAGGDDDDKFQIGDGTTPGTNPFVTVNTSGQVGIGTATPGAALEVSSASGDIRVGRTGGSKYSPSVVFRNADDALTLAYLQTDQEGTDGGLLKIFIRNDVDNAATRVMTIAGSPEAGAGRVGINDTTPDATLDVEKASATVAIFDRLTDDGTIISLRQAGTEEGTISVSDTTVSYNAFTGSHYGWTDQLIERGMLVKLTGENRHHHDNPESEMVYGIEKSQMENDPAILGAYLSIEDPNDPLSSDNHHLVMAVGNGVMWVVDNGEDLKPGDYLISSGVPGHAMVDPRTDPESHIIAKVAEPVQWDEVTETTLEAGVPQKHKIVSVLFTTFSRDNSQAVLP